MNQEELLKMLGLDQAVERPEEDDDLDINLFGTGESEDVEITDSVLQLTDWDIEQGQRLRTDVNDTCSELTMGDFFNMFYAQRPQLAGQCHDGRRQSFVEAMMESETYKSLHETTRANVMKSDAAALNCAREFLKLVREDEKHEQAEEGQPGEPSNDQGMRALRAAFKALEETEKQIDDMNDTMEALGRGCGDEMASMGSLDVNRINQVFQRIRRSTMLRNIFEKAGRLRRYARAAQRTKSIHGSDEMVGVTTGDNVGRLVPTELAMLADEDLELDAMRRFVEKQSMMWDMRGADKKAKGPIVVVVDESGSMGGERIEAAKALTLTMAWIAKKQKRWIALVSFSSRVSGHRALLLKPGQWDDLKLLDWLEAFLGGGTSLHVLCDTIPNKLWKEFSPPKGKTDVILITDASVGVEDYHRRSFLEWKEREQVKMITLVVQSTPGQIDTISDEVHEIPSISLDEEGVRACLEI